MALPSWPSKRNRHPPCKVPLLDLKPQYRPLAAEIQAAIEKGLRNSALHPRAPALKELEGERCGLQQCRHGSGSPRVTDALLLALMALEIGPGDAVITSPFTFFATAGPSHAPRARPLFCDIDPVTFNLSPAALQTFIEKYCERARGRAAAPLVAAQKCAPSCRCICTGR